MLSQADGPFINLARRVAVLEFLISFHKNLWQAEHWQVCRESSNCEGELTVIVRPKEGSITTRAPDGANKNLQNIMSIFQYICQALFEYIFHHENSIREAMELAAQAVVATKYCQLST